MFQPQIVNTSLATDDYMLLWRSLVGWEIEDNKVKSLQIYQSLQIHATQYLDFEKNK